MIVKVKLAGYIWAKSLPVSTILGTFLARLLQLAIFVHERKATQNVNL